MSICADALSSAIGRVLVAGSVSAMLHSFNDMRHISVVEEGVHGKAEDFLARLFGLRHA